MSFAIRLTAEMLPYLLYCRYVSVFTPHGLYRSDFSCEKNVWMHITCVYDANSDDDIFAGQVFVDNTVDVLVEMKFNSFMAGTGNMVLGRSFTNQDDKYSNVLIDDLAMWNRKLTEEEIKEIEEIEI